MPNTPIRCPYCSSIENNGRTCFWCGNPVTDNYYESEEQIMTIELKFSGLSPELALALLRTASGTSAEAEVRAEAPAPTPTALAIQPSAAVIPLNAPVATPAAAVVPPVVAAIPPTAPVVPAAQSAPAPAPAPAPIPTAPPTAVKQYTADELAVAARPICEMPGGREKLLDLLHSFTYTDSTGAVRTVQSIMEMPQELYPALANGIRQLGGRI